MKKLLLITAIAALSLNAFAGNSVEISCVDDASANYHDLELRGNSCKRIRKNAEADLYKMRVKSKTRAVIIVEENGSKRLVIGGIGVQWTNEYIGNEIDLGDSRLYTTGSQMTDLTITYDSDNHAFAPFGGTISQGNSDDSQTSLTCFDVDTIMDKAGC
jgi:hypothetical protein